MNKTWIKEPFKKEQKNDKISIEFLKQYIIVSLHVFFYI